MDAQDLSNSTDEDVSEVVAPSKTTKQPAGKLNRKFKKGEKVRILPAPMVLVRNPDRIGHVGTIVSVPFHPNTWYKVKFEDSAIKGFRSLSMVSASQKEDPVSTTSRTRSRVRSGSAAESQTSVSAELTGKTVVIKTGAQKGKIGKVMSVANGWVQVKIPPASGDIFAKRAYDLNTLGEDVQDAKSVASTSNASRSSKTSTSKASDLSSNDYVGKTVKIVYGKFSGNKGLVTGVAPGYLVISCQTLSEDGSPVTIEARKRKNHVVVEEDGDQSVDTLLETGSTEEDLDVKDETKDVNTGVGSLVQAMLTVPVTRGRKKTKGRGKGKRKAARGARSKAYTNPAVAKLLRKKVAVLETGLIGKVVYYDSKKDTYTVRLNENNSYNLKKLEESSKELDIACKLKLTSAEIMLWDEYKQKNGILEDKDLASAKSGSSVSFRFEGDGSKSRSQRAMQRATRREKNSNDDDNSETGEQRTQANLMAALQKAMKFRRNALTQYLKMVEERTKKELPFRPDLHRYMKKLNSEIDCDYTVFERGPVDDEGEFPDAFAVQAAMRKSNEILVTVRNTPTTSMLGQECYDEDRSEPAERHARGKYPALYNPPLCRLCGIEKLKLGGACWNKSCKASALFNGSSVSTEEVELVDMYSYNKRFKPSSIISSIISDRKSKQVSLSVIQDVGDKKEESEGITKPKEEPRPKRSWFSRNDGTEKPLSKDSSVVVVGQKHSLDYDEVVGSQEEGFWKRWRIQEPNETQLKA